MSKRNALGKGLGALISDANDVDENGEIIASSIHEISISNIEVNPFQPRKEFNQEALEELAQSIKAIGIVQPITVREISYEKYQIIAGERRFRASKLAGLKNIPAYIRQADDDKMLELALVENIQRENLDAIEEALSYQSLIEDCKLTQEQMSERVGKKRSTITNFLRLLKLPVEIQKGVKNKDISMGHARALLGLEDEETQIMIYEQILKYEFSVRKVEEIVRQQNNPELAEEKARKAAEKVANKEAKKAYKSLESKLTNYFDSKVKLKCTAEGNGKIEIPFTSNEELERIIEILDKNK